MHLYTIKKIMEKQKIFPVATIRNKTVKSEKMFVFFPVSYNEKNLGPI